MAFGLLQAVHYLSLVISISALLPSGNNVCMVNERFTTTVKVEEPFQYRKRKTEWCFKIPPRCSKYETAWDWRWVNKEVTELRPVAKCCLGYVAGPEDTHCRPHCSTPCKHGVCTAPDQCQCEAGYQGEICEASCLRGSWGVNCSETCDCRNGAFCETVQGNCHCAAGWIGNKCEQPCPEGFHGIDCKLNCQCGESTPCHHITGDCFISTTSTSESPSTSTETTSQSNTVTFSTEETISREVSTFNSLLFSTESLTTTKYSINLATGLSIVSSTDISTLATDHSTVVTDHSTTTVETSTSYPTVSINNVTEVSTIVSDISDISTHSISTFPTTVTSDWSSMSSFPTETSTTLKEVTQIIETETSSTIEISSLNTPAKTEGEEISSGQELAGLAITIVLSVLGAVVLLIAAAGIALTRHRKINNQIQIASTDLGIHKFYGEINIPVKTLFHNPTYNCDIVDLQSDKPVLRTFTPTQDTFDAELREILEAHYDHPPSIVGQLSLSVEHLYDEIAATYDEARDITAFRTFS